MENPPYVIPIDIKYPRQKQGEKWAMTENIKMAIEPSNIVLFVE